MEFAMFSTALLVIATLLVLSFHIITKRLKSRLSLSPPLPPGSLGWPIIGESPVFVRSGLAGKPERFVRERMEKYDSRVFKTSLLGYPIFVFCGPAGHKFLFSNENKAVNIWWPSSVKKLFKHSMLNVVGDEAKRMRKMLMTALNPDALKSYVERMDLITQEHIRTYWEGKEEVKVYPTAKFYTFQLACQLFASVDDPEHVSMLAAEFDVFLKGIIAFPINIPGTRFYRAVKAANSIREILQWLTRQRKAALEKKMASPTQDLLSHLLMTADESGRFLTEMEIIDNILLFLFAGHDTSRSAITLVMKYLAELPQVYEKVLKEQIDIAKTLEPGQSLKWEDIQNMRYSWNVVSEVLRLSPPVGGGFREAKVDFTYAGYTIPKGWKLYWSTGSTHKDPTLYPNPENFDASRFEGAGPTPYSYVPFGGGPRMCLGLEFARLEILVFLHNIVKKFKWDVAIHGEHFGYDPMLAPSHGLPVRLQPHCWYS